MNMKLLTTVLISLLTTFTVVKAKEPIKPNYISGQCAGFLAEIKKAVSFSDRIHTIQKWQHTLQPDEVTRALTTLPNLSTEQDLQVLDVGISYLRNYYAIRRDFDLSAIYSLLSQLPDYENKMKEKKIYLVHDFIILAKPSPQEVFQLLNYLYAKEADVFIIKNAILMYLESTDVVDERGIAKARTAWKITIRDAFTYILPFVPFLEEGSVDDGIYAIFKTMLSQHSEFTDEEFEAYAKLLKRKISSIDEILESRAEWKMRSKLD